MWYSYYVAKNAQNNILIDLFSILVSYLTGLVHDFYCFFCMLVICTWKTEVHNSALYYSNTLSIGIINHNLHLLVVV